MIGLPMERPVIWPLAIATTERPGLERSCRTISTSLPMICCKPSTTHFRVSITSSRSRAFFGLIKRLIPSACVRNLDDQLDFHGHAHGQRIGAYGGARMPPTVTQHVQQ